MLDRTLSTTLKNLFFGRESAASRPLTPDQKRSFEENGFLILPGFFSLKTMGSVKQHLDYLWDNRTTIANLVIDLYFDLPNEERTHFRKASQQARGFPYKLLDLHLEDALIRDISSALPLMDVLHRLLGARPLVCNSLLFERGSQQYPHFDTFFMPSKTRNMMAASWVAVDPVTTTNGPVYYYPKSHLIDPYLFSHGKMNAIFSEIESGAAPHIRRIIEQHDLRKEVFLADPGDVLIWHAQLLHGGSEIINPSETRCSLVTHYWTETDFPDADQRLDLGDGRWILKRAPMHVVDHDSLAEVDVFLAILVVTDEMRAAVPKSFDARLYLARNQDILRAGENPWLHYANHGFREGRVW